MSRSIHYFGPACTVVGGRVMWTLEHHHCGQVHHWMHAMCRGRMCVTPVIGGFVREAGMKRVRSAKRKAAHRASPLLARCDKRRPIMRLQPI